MNDTVGKQKRIEKIKKRNAESAKGGYKYPAEIRKERLFEPRKHAKKTLVAEAEPANETTSVLKTLLDYIICLFIPLFAVQLAIHKDG